MQVLRNIDDETAGTSDHNLIYTSALTKTAARTRAGSRSCTDRKVRASSTTAPRARPAHSSPASSSDAANAGCLDRTFIGIHCNAIAAIRLATLGHEAKPAPSPGRPSPICGSTARLADIAAARKQGVSDLPRLRLGTLGHEERPRARLKVAKLAEPETWDSD